MIFQYIYNSKFFQSILKAVGIFIGFIISYKLIKYEGRKAGKLEAKADAAEDLNKAVKKYKEIEAKVHEEVNAIEDDDLDDIGRKLGILRDD